MDNFDRKKPKVSIIIPSWFKDEGQDGKYGKNETFWFAGHCLMRLLAATPKDLYELIIIDNGSDDIMFDMGEGNLLDPLDYWKHADVLIKNPKNLGFAPAVNQGMDLARGEYIVCLNNDILVWPGWLEAVLLAFEDLPNEKNKKKPGVVMTSLVKNLKDAREALKVKQIELKQNFNEYSPGAEFGSLWVAPATVLEEIRQLNKEEIGEATVFDENFKLGMGEDRKLWQQTRLLGYETYRTHKTRVFHQGNMSIAKVPNRKLYTTKNREYLQEWKDKHNLK